MTTNAQLQAARQQLQPHLHALAMLDWQVRDLCDAILDVAYHRILACMPSSHGFVPEIYDAKLFATLSPGSWGKNPPRRKNMPALVRTLLGTGLCDLLSKTVEFLRLGFACKPPCAQCCCVQVSGAMSIST